MFQTEIFNGGVVIVSKDNEAEYMYFLCSGKWICDGDTVDQRTATNLNNVLRGHAETLRKGMEAIS
jgi:hypothetical protein